MNPISVMVWDTVSGWRFMKNRWFLLAVRLLLRRAWSLPLNPGSMCLVLVVSEYDYLRCVLDSFAIYYLLFTTREEAA